MPIRKFIPKFKAFFTLLPLLMLCLAKLVLADEPTVFPNASMQDFSRTLERPAGRKGFLQRGEAGHFVWKDGSRAKFWGINVSSTRLNIPPDEIEKVVKSFARAGLNMVRLEAIDNRNCLLGKVEAPDSQHFDREYLDRLDHWMDSLRRHGIYYYLDLLDFRTFKTGDSVLHAEELDRAARPYALFDSYLIQLQKEYATRLLTHRNPYSNLRPIDDPAFALIEICNEHGFFLYPEKLETLLEPYAGDLNRRWNAWLRLKYGTRENLSAAWGKIGLQQALRIEEDPAGNTVDLPLLSGNPDASGPDNTASRRAPARRKDGTEFLVGLQRAYFREMRDHLLSIGVKIPITAVVSADVVPDVSSVAQECDFISENWYGEGINGDLKNSPLKYYSNRNNLSNDNIGGFAPYTSMLRWNNSPVVIREWATTWPNRSRAASIPEALAYSSLQDYDAVLLFGYQTNTAPNGSKADALNDFAFQSDPTVWGLASLAGQAFLKSAIAPAQLSVTLAYPFSRQYVWPQNGNSLHRIAWTSRVNSVFSDSPLKGLTVVPTGSDDDLNRLQGILSLLKKQGSAVGEDSIKTRVWRSDTGEIVRDSKAGRIDVRTPVFCLTSGSFSPGQIYDLGIFKFSTSSQFGTLFICALDGQPMRNSHHIVIKMVTRASNTGEAFELSEPGAPSRWVLKQSGAAPVLTFGKRSKTGARIWLSSSFKTRSSNKAIQAPKTEKNRSVLKKSNNPPRKSAKKGPPAKPAPLPAPVFSLLMEDGTWELEMIDGKAILNTDTEGVKGWIQGRTFTTVNGIQKITE